MFKFPILEKLNFDLLKIISKIKLNVPGHRIYCLNFRVFFCWHRKLKRDSLLAPSETDGDSGAATSADLLLQQKEEEIRRMKNMLENMQQQLKIQQRSKSLGETQLQREFSLVKGEENNGVRLWEISIQ